MSAFDYIAATNLSIAAFFLIVHAVMVGNPQYGWQPRSLLVRAGMVILAFYLAARAYSIIYLSDPMTPLAQQIAFVMAALFFLTWLDMVVTSWKLQMDEVKRDARGDAEHAFAAEMMDRVCAEVQTTQEQSVANGAAIEEIRSTVSILNPAPHEFKDAIGYKA